MTRKTLAALASLGLIAPPALAQTVSLTFDRAAYVTCREAQAMAPEQRRALAVFLADHVARQRGVAIPDGEQGAQLAQLVRGGCTLSPEAYLFAVIDRAVQAELVKLPKR